MEPEKMEEHSTLAQIELVRIARPHRVFGCTSCIQDHESCLSRGQRITTPLRDDFICDPCLQRTGAPTKNMCILLPLNELISLHLKKPKISQDEVRVRIFFPGESDIEEFCEGLARKFFRCRYYGRGCTGEFATESDAKWHGERCSLGWTSADSTVTSKPQKFDQGVVKRGVGHTSLGSTEHAISPPFEGYFKTRFAARIRATFSKFATHTRGCSRCANALATFLLEKEMCPRGKHIAKEVVPSLFDLADEYTNSEYTNPDRKSDLRMDPREQHLEVDIPESYDVLWSLLVAIHRGLELPSGNPPDIACPNFSNGCEEMFFDLEEVKTHFSLGCLFRPEPEPTRQRKFRLLQKNLNEVLASYVSVSKSIWSNVSGSVKDIKRFKNAVGVMKMWIRDLYKAEPGQFAAVLGSSKPLKLQLSSALHQIASLLLRVPSLTWPGLAPAPAPMQRILHNVKVTRIVRELEEMCPELRDTGVGAGETLNVEGKQAELERVATRAPEIKIQDLITSTFPMATQWNCQETKTFDAGIDDWPTLGSSDNYVPGTTEKIDFANAEQLDETKHDVSTPTCLSLAESDDSGYDWTFAHFVTRFSDLSEDLCEVADTILSEIDNIKADKTIAAKQREGTINSVTDDEKIEKGSPIELHKSTLDQTFGVSAPAGARSSEHYVLYLSSLCRRRRWDDPQFQIKHEGAGYGCLVRVNGRTYLAEPVYPTESRAREAAAQLAYQSNASGDCELPPFRGASGKAVNIARELDRIPRDVQSF